MRIEIEGATCIECERCVRVCPSEIFINSSSKIPNVQNIDLCIKCGHCVAICPTDSIFHEIFPPDKVHPFDKKELPTSEQLMKLFKARRSGRVFTKDPVPEYLIDQIVEAAHRAPTASNSQKVYFKVITDPDQLLMISDFTVQTFKKLARFLNFPLIKPFLKILAPDLVKYIPAFYEMEKEYKAGKDMILRGATAVIFIYSPKNQFYGSADCNLAYQNGSLMAETLGIAQFYTGFVLTALERDNRGILYKSLGIKGVVHAGMALGVPPFHFSKYIDRKEVIR
ncbi:MAG: nitroreductase family protein [Bacteroidales bacterium]|jgi:nitroreductase/NAD-dependent dihydropyrimidine dehydrogenase PreA subunit|nr:nitroreductase family protein [Bacteroidales bacterium]